MIRVAFLVAGVSAATVGGAASVGHGASAQVDPRTVEAEFQVRWLGLRVYSGQTRIEIGRRFYRVISTARSRGILEMFGKSRIGSDANGRIDAARLRPAAFTARSRWRKKRRLVLLTYTGNGRVLTKVVPREHKGKRPPVPLAMQKAAYDPATAFLAGITTPFSGPPCRLTLPVFDGRRRFDMRLEFIEHTRLTRLIEGITTTKAVKCRMRMHRIAGFTEKHLKKNPDPLPAAELLIAKVARGNVWFPVRFTLSTKWGPIVSDLVRLKVQRGIAD
ncbi:MAG: DUF3108 domain-containing protein [Pseudomonadota bacterium]